MIDLGLFKKMRERTFNCKKSHKSDMYFYEISSKVGHHFKFGLNFLSEKYLY